MTTKETRMVAEIKDGTVIDHITAGSAVKIFQLLNLHQHPKRVSIGLNCFSHVLGCKDMIKVEQRELTPAEVNQVAIFAPDATISIVKDYSISKKFQIALPEVIEGIFPCDNNQCITNHDEVSTLFFVQNGVKSIRLVCKYCNKVKAQR